MNNLSIKCLRNLRFVLCSRDLDALRAQRIIGFIFILTSQKPTRSRISITYIVEPVYIANFLYIFQEM